MNKLLILDRADNVAVALESIERGEEVLLPDGKEITALDPIPFAHKIATQQVDEGATIIKYGEVIGLATKVITVGEHVHVHNIRSQRQ
jgi:altronate dehydratase